MSMVERTARRGSIATSALLLAVGVVVAASAAQAAPATLTGGRRLVSRDSSSPSHDRTNLRFSGDPMLYALGDPTCPRSSSLRIVGDGYDSGELALPCAKWVRSGTSYRYQSDANGVGGVRRLMLGPGTFTATLAGPLHRPVPTTTSFVEVRLVIGGAEACGRLVALASGDATILRAVGPSTACSAIPPRPNILVVNLDDTRADGVGLMPVLETRIAAAGQTFTNSFTPDPLCCPSRASLLTGLYALHHGTRTLTAPNGGAIRFRELGGDQKTIAVWLQGAGYRTGLFGKYLNAYSAGTEGGLGPNGGLYVPPGWDRWWAMVSGEAYGGVNGVTYRVSEEDGTLTVYDDHSSDAQYSTDLSARKMRDFVSAAVADGQPFFAYWTPVASHTDGFAPPAPAARHHGLFADLPLWRPPSWGEADVTDKPRAYASLGVETTGYTDLMRRSAYETLLAVDEQLGAFLDLVDGLGVGNDTVILFTSDNGVMWGEHRLFNQSKGCPYEECQRVPFVVRYPRLGTPGTVRTEPVLNIDVAPTIANLAGVAPPTAVDGRSIVPLLVGTAPTPAWRADYLMESYRSDCRDAVTLSALPVDGDQLRLFYGNPWGTTARPSAVFEFDTNGVATAGTILVPVQSTPTQTATKLGQTVATTLPALRRVTSFTAGETIVEDVTAGCYGPIWWEELDQTNVIRPKNTPPAYFGVRDVANGFTWVEYETGERELYDLNVDPHQMESRHADPAYAPLSAMLSARTAELRNK